MRVEPNAAVVGTVKLAVNVAAVVVVPVTTNSSAAKVPS